jgi:hypothetical protein
MPKGDKVIGPKQRDHTTTHPFSNFQKTFHKREEIISNFQKLFHKGEEIISITKTLLTAKGRTYSGELLFSQRKAFETGGEFSKSRKCFLNHTLILLAIGKRIRK